MLARKIIFRSSLQKQKCVRTVFWWGHDTPEDQEARIKAIEDKKIIKWDGDGPDSTGLALTKESFYAPARISQEEDAMSTGYSYDRLNIADMYSVTCYKWGAYFNDPWFYYCEKGKKDYRKLINGQRFMRDRVITLGPDLAAAYFLLARGCKVRFKHQKDWMGDVETPGFSQIRQLEQLLPTSYEAGWHLEAIEACDSKLIYEGFSNLKNLTSLKYLDLSYCPNIDAWCMDRITGEYADTLEYLDLSGCKSLQWNGLECLWRLSKLKTLVLRDLVRRNRYLLTLYYEA